jgi:hypothetical protein
LVFNESNLTGTAISITNLINYKEYYWRVNAKNSNGTSEWSEVWNFRTSQIFSSPLVSTSIPTNITPTSAVVGGNVISDFSESITERGVYWGTTQNPETSGSKLIIGSGSGTYSATLSGLAPNTQYYLKGYAINAIGIGYGNQVNFTTSDNTGASTLKSNLISYWKFDEGNGVITSDGVSGFTGTLTNCTWSPNGKINKGIDFNGTSSVVSIPHNSVFNTQTFTISFWAKSTSTSRQVPISKWWNNQTRQWEVAFNDNNTIGGIAFFIGYSGSFKVVRYTASQSYDGNWHLYTFTMNNGLIKIWIDGIEKASANTGYTMLYNDRPIYIGQDSYYGIPNSLPFKGIIDEPAIWVRALTANEIKALYNYGSGLQYPF